MPRSQLAPGRSPSSPPPQPAADVTSALSSVKSIVAIVNGLTLTNTLLILITGGHYSNVTPLNKVPLVNVAFSVVLIANIVRFYHGNIRHLDSAYGSESAARAASGRHAPPRGGLGVDFFVVFVQSLIFAVASFYAGRHSEFVSLFIVLLIFDIFWSIYAQQSAGGTATSGAPQREWLLNNLGAVIFLVVFYLIHRAHPAESWSLDVALGGLAITTIVDFVLSWGFYFPSTVDAPTAG